MLDVSIIIVNYNTKNLTARLLDTLHLYLKKIKYEMIIVDNNSNDGSAEFIHDNYPEVMLLKNTYNAGFGKANNQAFRISKGRHLLLLNSDTYLKEDSVSIMSAYLDAHPNIGIIGCKLINEANEQQSSYGVFPSLKTVFLQKIYFYKFINTLIYKKKGVPKINADQYVDWVTGAALMIKKSVINEISGFDENFFMFFEDTDLCFRAKEKGWEVAYVPQTSIVHLWGGSWKKNRRKTIIDNYTSTLLYFSKRENALNIFILKCIFFVDSIIRMLISSIFYLFSPNEKELSKERLAGYYYIISQSIHLQKQVK